MQPELARCYTGRVVWYAVHSCGASRSHLPRYMSRARRPTEARSGCDRPRSCDDMASTDSSYIVRYFATCPASYPARGTIRSFPWHRAPPHPVCVCARACICVRVCVYVCVRVRVLFSQLPSAGRAQAAKSSESNIADHCLYAVGRLSATGAQAHRAIGEQPSLQQVLVKRVRKPT